MMKRLTALCLALLLLFTATAYATGWEEGYSPSKPYKDAPEADFEKTIGHMLFYPNGKVEAHDCKTLFVYLPRDDVKLNNTNGINLTLRSADGLENYTFSVTDSEHVVMRPLTPFELEGLLFGGGQCIQISLPVSLRLDCTYYVDMDEAFIMDEERKIGSTAFKSSDDDHWRFTLTSDYGISELAYFRTNDAGVAEPVLSPADGDTARFDVVLGGDAKSATIALIAGDMEFSEVNITESCEVTAEIKSDYPQWRIYFWDTETAPLENAADHIVNALDF